MTVFTVLLHTGNPKRFSGLHVDVISARFSAPLPLQLHQTPAIEIQCPTSLRWGDIANPSRTVVGMAALLLYVPKKFHWSECAIRSLLDQLTKSGVGVEKLFFSNSAKISSR